MKLFIKHKLRKWSISFEHFTANLVIPRNAKLAHLIENTDNPKFDEYFEKLEKFKQSWGIDDIELDRYAIQGRLMQFKHKKSLK